MAFEVEDWKEENCSLGLDINKLSSRETYSQEINKMYGEGGGLNANYRTVEAGIRAANILGNNSLVHGRDFVFKTSGLGVISFDFCDKKTKARAEKALKNFLN